MSRGDISTAGKLDLAARRQLLLAACELDRLRLRAACARRTRPHSETSSAAADILGMVDAESLVSLAVSFLPRRYRVFALLLRVGADFLGKQRESMR